MRPIIVILGYHPSSVLKWLFEGCAEDFVNDDYKIIAHEGQRDAESLEVKKFIENVQRGYEDLKRTQPANQEHKNALDRRIEINRLVYEEMLPFAKFPGISVKRIDTATEGFDSSLEIRQDLLLSINPIRDEAIAKNLEKIYKLNSGKGIIADIGLMHFGVQHFLIKQNGIKSLEHYRFIYFFNNDEESLDKLGIKVDQGAEALNIIDCRNRTQKDVYQEIKKIIASSPRPINLTAEQQEKLSIQLDNQLLIAEKSMKILKRISITMNAIEKYLKSKKKVELHRNRLFHLLQHILTQLNIKNLKYGDNQGEAKLILEHQITLLKLCELQNETPEIIQSYQNAIDYLIPRIQQEFTKQNLNDPSATDFIYALEQKKQQTIGELCKQFGIYAVTGIAAVVVGITFYYANNTEPALKL